MCLDQLNWSGHNNLRRFFHIPKQESSGSLTAIFLSSSLLSLWLLTACGASSSSYSAEGYHARLQRLSPLLALAAILFYKYATSRATLAGASPHGRDRNLWPVRLQVWLWRTSLRYLRLNQTALLPQSAAFVLALIFVRRCEYGVALPVGFKRCCRRRRARLLQQHHGQIVQGALVVDAPE